MMTRLILWLTCLVLIAACAAPATSSLNGTTWRLQNIDGTAVTSDVNATIAFVDGQFNGNGGCNSYGGMYTATATTITFTLGQMTMMACMGPGGDTEIQYMAVLPQITTVSAQTDTQLTLGDAKNANRLVFTRITP